MTAKPSVPAPFVRSPSADSDKSEDSMKDAMLCIGLTVLLALFIFLACFNIYAACALASLVWTIWVTVWICKIKNRQTEAVKAQTEAVEVLKEILKEIKK